MTAGAGVELRPVPVRGTVWGLPLALSEMLTLAVRVPLAVGVKVTLIVQLTLAATLPPDVGQVVPDASTKSPGFVPVMLMLVMVRVALPKLLSSTDCAALVVPTF